MREIIKKINSWGNKDYSEDLTHYDIVKAVIVAFICTILILIGFSNC